MWSELPRKLRIARLIMLSLEEEGSSVNVIERTLQYAVRALLDLSADEIRVVVSYPRVLGFVPHYRGFQGAC